MWYEQSRAMCPRQKRVIERWWAWQGFPGGCREKVNPVKLAVGGREGGQGDLLLITGTRIDDRTPAWNRFNEHSKVHLSMTNHLEANHGCPASINHIR